MDVQKSVQCLKLGCLFLLLLAVQSLAVAAEKEPLKVTGTLELMALGLLTCIAAVAVWEAGKAFYRWLVPNVIGSKRSRRIQKLRELARAAAEAEIEKWVEQDVPIPGRQDPKRSSSRGTVDIADPACSVRSGHP